MPLSGIAPTLLHPARRFCRSDCGEWRWIPGGARSKPRWVGPTFTLSTALGTCALLSPGTGPTVIGQGSPTWTSVQLARLACQGPSLQYGFVSGCGARRASISITVSLLNAAIRMMRIQQRLPRSSVCAAPSSAAALT